MWHFRSDKDVTFFRLSTDGCIARIMMSETPYDNRARRQLQNFNSKEEEMLLE